MVASRKSRKNRQGGGGWGFTGASSIPGSVSNPLVYTNTGDCNAAKPPGFLSSMSPRGIPGMAGGKRRRASRRSRQRGGRYGFDPTQNLTPNGAGVGLASYAPVHRIACENANTTHNTLNTGKQFGGGLGGDSLAYYAPTAGFENKPSSWVDSVGGPVQLQVPYDARSMNQACLTTGGPQKGGKRRSRKNRKNRKASRRNRKN